jgi:hypothetical protein
MLPLWPLELRCSIEETLLSLILLALGFSETKVRQGSEIFLVVVKMVALTMSQIKSIAVLVCWSGRVPA